MRQLCLSHEISEGASKGLQVDGENIFIVRQDGNVYCFENACPHLGIPLEWQPDQFLDVDGELIQCSTHGALFTITKGECVSGPCLGKTLQARQVHEDNGAIYLI